MSRQEGAFGQREAEMLVQIAGQVAMAVNNAMAFKHIAELRDRLKQEKQYLEEEINLEHRFDDIVGESTGLRNVLRQIETVAPTDATVLIQGETGTGKELLARAIHRLSPRSERTFIKLNCAAIPAGLLESELFGHEKGAFTGAIARKIGRLELAHEGTLFLDEVGELPLDLQPKLLRALQEREIERLGGTRPIPVNVRLIAATNRDLAKMVAEKQFRSDLFYRLKVFPVFAPPLRERAADIPVLVRHFVSRHARRMGKTIETIPPEAMAALVAWKWPGNIRELENFLERAVILSRGPVLHVPLAELEAMEEEEEEAVRGLDQSHAAGRRARPYSARAARGQRHHRRTRRRSRAARPQAHHAQLQNEEARHRARRLYVVFVTKYRHRHFVTRRASSRTIATLPQNQILSFNRMQPRRRARLKFGTRRALSQAWRRTSQQVLRITVEENSNAIVIKLEGRIAGPWAAELGRLWEEKAPAVAQKKLSLDLRETTFADAGGIRVLKAIYSQTGAAILTGTPWTQYLAEEVARKDSQPADTEG